MLTKQTDDLILYTNTKYKTYKEIAESHGVDYNKLLKNKEEYSNLNTALAKSYNNDDMKFKKGQQVNGTSLVLVEFSQSIFYLVQCNYNGVIYALHYNERTDNYILRMERNSQSKEFNTKTDTLPTDASEVMKELLKVMFSKNKGTYLLHFNMLGGKPQVKTPQELERDYINNYIAEVKRRTGITNIVEKGGVLYNMDAINRGYNEMAYICKVPKNK